MFKALRKAAATVGLTKSDDQDVSDKKRLQELYTQNEAVKRNLGVYVKSLQDSYTHAMALYDSIATLYPHNQELTAKLDTLVSKGEFFKGVKDQMEAARKGVEDALAAVAVLHKDLAKKTEDRAGFRVEIGHYNEKLPKLFADAGKGPKEKERHEENSKKLEDVRAKFAAADAELVPLLEKLDSDVAAATTAAFSAFVDAQRALATLTAELYAAALAATDSPAAAAPAPEAATAPQ